MEPAEDPVQDVAMTEAALEPPALPSPKKGSDLQARHTGPLLWVMLFVMSKMSRIFSRFVLLAVGALYPAYLSCKAVRARSPRDYVRWMMYWVVFAAFLCVEPLTDVLFGCCLPLYAELKIAFVFWLQSSTTRGASLLFRKLVLPEFTRRESDIDAHLGQLHTRASQVGATTVRYMTQAVMHTVFSHIRENYSVADLVSSDLKLSLFDPIEGSSSLEDPSEMALGDQGGRRRTHRRVEDEPKKRKLSAVSAL
uniref:Receptor expression-enhancing protein n=1 Tax=Rhipicephalus appendiculatus TaxID=34631 RepID=A0A131YNL5_RHIAP